MFRVLKIIKLEMLNMFVKARQKISFVAREGVRFACSEATSFAESLDRFSVVFSNRKNIWRKNL